MRSPARRKFIKESVASSCLLALSPGSYLGGEEPLLEEEVAAAARALHAGRGLTLRLLLPEGSAGNVLPIVRRFTATTGIDIELKTTGVDEINSKLLLHRLTGSADFDIALPATFGIPDLAEAGALLPLDQFARRYEAASLQQGSLYNVGDYYQGKLYGYQADGDVYLMFYNAAFLADAHYQDSYAERFGSPLALPRSWAELDRLLAFFHNPGQQRYGGALFRTPRYIAWEFWMRLHSKGQLPFDEDMQPLLTTDAGIDALAELTNASRYLYPGATTNNLFENWEAFAGGRIFCNIGWGGSQKYFRRHAANFPRGLKYSHAPGDDVERAGHTVSFFNWGWNYAVPTGSHHPELAYLFALYAATPAMSTLAVRQPDGFFDPFRAEHYADAEITDVYSQEFLDAHRSAMIGAIPDLHLRGQSRYMEILSDYIVQADRRQLSPSEALQAVAKLWDETTNQLGRSEQARQWRALLAGYPAGLRKPVS